MDNKNNTAIVFFSKDGNTRLGANLLHNRIGDIIIELKERKKGNFVQALLKKGSHLEGQPWTEIQDARQIYLMLPIWASNGTPAMNTFLQHADFNGKKVCIITFQQFEDLRNSDKVHQYISDIVAKSKGSVIANYSFVGGKMGTCAEESLIREQIDKVESITT